MARRLSGTGRWAASPTFELSVHYKGNEVFSAPLIRGDPLQMYPKQGYRIYADRLVTDPAAAAAQGTKP